MRLTACVPAGSARVAYLVFITAAVVFIIARGNCRARKKTGPSSIGRRKGYCSDARLPPLD